MKKHRFTEEERNLLIANPNIARVINSNVKYTSSFNAYALTAFEKGQIAQHIFRQAGIPDYLNIKEYAKKAIYRWRDQKKKQ